MTLISNNVATVTWDAIKMISVSEYWDDEVNELRTVRILELWCEENKITMTRMPHGFNLVQKQSSLEIETLANRTTNRS